MMAWIDHRVHPDHRPYGGPDGTCGKAEEAFHVVIPSLPGSGFRPSRLTRMGLHASPMLGRSYAAFWVQPLRRARRRLGRRRNKLDGHRSGLGLCRDPSEFPDPLSAATTATGGYTSRNSQSWPNLASTQVMALAYGSIQGRASNVGNMVLPTRRLGKLCGYTRSFQEWSDNKGIRGGHLGRSHVGCITLYWLTDTAASSARLYYESWGKDFVRNAPRSPGCREYL